MEKDTIKELFGNLQDSFDLKEPEKGHHERFLSKLNASKDTLALTPKRITWWKPFSIAASFAVLVGMGIGLFQNNPTLEEQVAKISPEVSNTQFYFSNLVQQQVQELQTKSSPETQKIIADAMVQITNLEADYTELEKEVLNGGNNKMILSAMITNFQTRIDLLNYVLEQIETIKDLKKYTDANHTL